MADTPVNGAIAAPHDEGLPNIADGNEDWGSAGLKMALAQAGGPGNSWARSGGLKFTGHDAGNDQVDVTAGTAYLDLAGETVNVQSGLGGSDPPSYDTALPQLPSLMVIVPSNVTNLDVQDSTLSDVWLAYATDDSTPGITAGTVYLRSDDTGSVSAPSSHPNVKLGQANPDDASADTLANRFSVSNSDVEALANFSGGDTFESYPISLGNDTDRDLAGSNLNDSSTIIWNSTASHIPEGRVEQGSGSGLDADTVDGQDLASIQAAELFYIKERQGTVDTSNSWTTQHTKNVTDAWVTHMRLEAQGNDIRVRATYNDATAETLQTQSATSTSTYDEPVGESDSNRHKLVDTLELQEKGTNNLSTIEWELRGLQKLKNGTKV